MSEYQYYEFVAIDRPLSDDDMNWLRSLSTRATITSTSFTNEYNWGSLRGDPQKMMERCFDLFVYYANWGSRQFMVRLPRETIDIEQAKLYSGEEGVEILEKPDCVLLNFWRDDEPGNWDYWPDNAGWLASLASLRDDLLSGDLRSLYLGWLVGLEWAQDDDCEPPVPPGLKDINASLSALAEFLSIDDTLIEAAATRSADRTYAETTDDDLRTWIRSLDTAEKDKRLIDAALGVDPNPRRGLLRDFRIAMRPAQQARDDKSRQVRTVGELTAIWNKLEEEDRHRRVEEAEQERKRREKAEAVARRKHLAKVASRGHAVWREVAASIEKRTQQGYDRAVELLIDLRDAAEMEDETSVFEEHLCIVRNRHARKSNLIERLNQAGLNV